MYTSPVAAWWWSAGSVRSAQRYTHIHTPITYLKIKDFIAQNYRDRESGSLCVGQGTLKAKPNPFLPQSFSPMSGLAQRFSKFSNQGGDRYSCKWLWNKYINVSSEKGWGSGRASNFRESDLVSSASWDHVVCGLDKFGNWSQYRGPANCWIGFWINLKLCCDLQKCSLSCMRYEPRPPDPHCISHYQSVKPPDWPKKVSIA